MIPDFAAREKARRTLDKNIVVEAGAGTGKTTLLIDRLLFLIFAGGAEKKGIPLARIAAVTFTEKAAAEIKLRLSEKLSRLAADLSSDGTPSPSPLPLGEGIHKNSLPRGGRVGERGSEEELINEIARISGHSRARLREINQAALRDLEKAAIGTIHHFAATLLRLFPLAARVNPEFDVDPGPHFERIFDADWSLWLEKELAFNSPRAAAWLALLPLAPLDDLAALARAMVGENAADAAPANAGLAEAWRDLARRIGDLPKDKPVPRSGLIQEEIAQISEHLGAVADSLHQPGHLPRDSRAAVAPDFCAREWPKAWENLDGEDLYKKAVAAGCSVSVHAAAILEQVRVLLLPFARHVREKYNRLGYISYDGLLRKARDLVRDHFDVREQLKRQFEALLVDEFQDTDPLQGEIMMYLAEESGRPARNWRDTKLRPGKLFIVGDPKQSIYQFRGADIRAFEAFVAHALAQGAEKCDLQTNFRSGAGLINSVNQVFSSQMTATPGLQPAYLPILPPAPDAAAGPAVEIVLFEGEAEAAAAPSADAARRQEAAWIAQWIQKNARARQAGEARDGHCFGDVALLLRTASTIDIYIEALKDAGIPYLVESDRFFYGAQEVIDFMNWLRLLDNPGDRVSFLGLLRSPWVGLTDREIYDLHQADALHPEKIQGGAARAATASSEPLARFLQLYRQFRARVQREPLGDVLGDFFKESFFLEIAVSAYHGEQTLANLMKFRRMAEESSGARGATLAEFIGELERAMKNTREEGESPLADQHIDAVRILTIHKAKGLEYPVVFLPNLASAPQRHESDPAALRTDWRRGWTGMRLPSAGIEDAAMAFIDSDAAERQKAEALRVFYVAMTRAKSQLFCLARGGRPPKDSFLTYLSGAMAEAGAAAHFKIHTVRIETQRPEKKSAAAAARLSLDPAAAGDLWKKRYAENLAHQKPLFRAPSLGLSSTPSPKGGGEGEGVSPATAAWAGRICHRVLKDYDFKNGAAWEEILAKVLAAARWQAPEADWAAVGEESFSILSSFFSSELASRMAGWEILAREMPFLDNDGASLVRGAIDLLFEENGRLWVGDYKSDRVSEEDMPAAARSYASQGRDYAAAAAKALGKDCGFRVIFLRTGRLIDVPAGAGPV